MFVFGHVGLTAGIIYALSDRFNLRLDYRYVILGSMLSDIIDKPLGNFLLYSALNNGRIIGHSLIFVLLLTIIGMYRKNILYVAFGVWMHLLLDSMWLNPVTLFWPLLGNFHHLDFAFSNFAVSIFEPYNLIGEVAGFSILAYLALKHRLYMKANLSYFVRTGKLEN